MIDRCAVTVALDLHAAQQSVEHVVALAAESNAVARVVLIKNLELLQKRRVLDRNVRSAKDVKNMSREQVRFDLVSTEHATTAISRQHSLMEVALDAASAVVGQVGDNRHLAARVVVARRLGGALLLNRNHDVGLQGRIIDHLHQVKTVSCCYRFASPQR